MIFDKKRPRRIYVIDDDRDIVEAIKTILTKNGYEVGCQYDNENVVANAEAFKPDAIILDVIFPEDDSAGFDVARDLKKSRATANVPILMLSAINEKGVYGGSFSNRDRDDMFLPVDEFVEKPISPTHLLEKIARLAA